MLKIGISKYTYRIFICFMSEMDNLLIELIKKFRLINKHPVLRYTVSNEQGAPRPPLLVVIICFILIPWKIWLPPKVGVLVLPAQNPIKMQGWWKGKFVLFWISSWGEQSRELLSKGDSLYWQSVSRIFYKQREEATHSSDSHLEIGHRVV